MKMKNIENLYTSGAYHAISPYDSLYFPVLCFHMLSHDTYSTVQTSCENACYWWGTLPPPKAVTCSIGDISQVSLVTMSIKFCTLNDDVIHQAITSCFGKEEGLEEMQQAKSN